MTSESDRIVKKIDKSTITIGDFNILSPKIIG